MPIIKTVEYWIVLHECVVSKWYFNYQSMPCITSKTLLCYLLTRLQDGGGSRQVSKLCVICSHHW